MTKDAKKYSVHNLKRTEHARTFVCVHTCDEKRTETKNKFDTYLSKKIYNRFCRSKYYYVQKLDLINLVWNSAGRLMTSKFCTWFPYNNLVKCQALHARKDDLIFLHRLNQEGFGNIVYIADWSAPPFGSSSFSFFFSVPFCIKSWIGENDKMFALNLEQLLLKKAERKWQTYDQFW